MRSVHRARWGICVVTVLAGCNVFGLTGPAGFQTFTFERQFVFVGPHPTIESLSIEREGKDRYLLRFIRLIPDAAGGGAEREASVPRVLTATEQDEVLEAFRQVRWEAEADHETCPLWDPAYVDTFRWDQFSITTNLCHGPYLPHERAEPVREVLFRLVGGSP